MAWGNQLANLSSKPLKGSIDYVRNESRVAFFLNRHSGGISSNAKVTLLRVINQSVTQSFIVLQFSLSLAVPLWVSTVNTSESWGVNKHTARCTIPVSVMSQCKLVSGWELKTATSAALWDLWLKENFETSRLCCWKKVTCV